MVTDPVCGMAVETTSIYRSDHDGTTAWFCSQHCLDEFAADPNRFAETAKSR